MTVFFSQLINGLSLGSIYALIALGYSMVYGIILLLNFAHGDVIMVGAYMSWFVMNQLGLGPVTAVCATIITCTLLGVVIEKIAYTPLRSAPRISLLITAIGVSFFLEYTAELILGSGAKVIPAYYTNQTFRLGKVSGRNEDFFFFQFAGDLIRTVALNCHGKNALYHLCGFGVNQPLVSGFVPEIAVNDRAVRCLPDLPLDWKVERILRLVSLA